jgi:CBS domain-containing protein
MRESKVGAVLVVDGGRLAGIFSERDLATRVVAAGKSPDSTSVGEVASQPVVSVALGTSLRECAEKLRGKGVRHLPVLSDGKPVGILSARDFFEAVAGGFEVLIERARYDEKLRDNVDPYDHVGGSYGR